MSPDFRAALYWTPPPDDPLAEAGHRWLGRDPERNLTLPLAPPFDEITEAPRLYGFHATLAPPMRLATGWAEFCAAAEEIADNTAPFELPPLEIAELSGFLALRATAPCPPLQALADLCVRASLRHRLPASDSERAKRRANGLTPSQDRLLTTYGYPYVLEEWRFHMTLTRRLRAEERAHILPLARAHFAEALERKRCVSDIAVFTQIDGKAFLVAERFALKGRKTLLF